MKYCFEIEIISEAKAEKEIQTGSFTGRMIKLQNTSKTVSGPEMADNAD